jgi:hypothetical protein
MPNLVISMAGGKKVPERRSGLRPSEIELPERRSGAFRHKNTPIHTRKMPAVLLRENLTNAYIFCQSSLPEHVSLALPFDKQRWIS